MRPVRAVAMALGLATALPASAETDFTRLSEVERAIFHAEIRSALLDVPEILPDAPPVVIEDPYADAVDSDLARIAAYEDLLFAEGARLALVVAEDCPDCARSEQELRKISGSYGVTFTRIEAAANADLVRDLGLEQMPAYVFADRMFQGWMPVPVLERYLAE